MAVIICSAGAIMLDRALRTLSWSVANAKALMAGEETFSVELGGQTFYQDTGKYHARSLRVLRQRYQSLEVADRGG